MPDYDPKSIPILDDIIEEKVIEETEEDKDDATENNLDLFSDKAKDTAAEEPVIEQIEPQVGSIEDINGEVNTETDNIESALINYNAEEQSSQPAIEDQISEETTEEMPPASTTPLALEAIVDDVVKQLMPDLEQQLRFLLQTALEERLPEKLPEELLKNIKNKI